MIQFNLLPDIKIQYLKAKRQKHMVVLLSVVASGAMLVIFVLLLTTVFGLQKKNIADLNKDIKKASAQLQSVKDLDKILTVQNQLGALTPLHDSKVVAPRLLDYLTQLTPADAFISKMAVDFAGNTMTIDGAAAGLNSVNTFTDTLKFTTYNTGEGTPEKPAFSSVVLKSFTRDDKTTTYQIQMSFDPLIFSSAYQVKLTVPQITTTRSEVDKPTGLFQSQGAKP
jgi:Tfp pilus assembly protein PilN